MGSNQEPDLSGYAIHYGTASRSYDVSVDVGNWTTCTVDGLEENVTYYFAATAYDLFGNHSEQNRPSDLDLFS